MHGLEGQYGNCIDFVYLDVDSAATKNAKDRLGYQAQPDFFLVDKTGKVVWKKYGMLTETELDTQLRSVLTP